ncbi:hypothetical protein Hdeb2414_s0025g00662081 [Helianthus debilis subsp. tardiflorus]
MYQDPTINYVELTLDCVANAISQLKTTCPMSIGGEIQLEGCLVEVWRRCGPSVGYNLDVVNRINGALGYLMGGGGQYFRGGAFGSIQEACGRLRTECETSTWGDMYMGKCYIRYADQGNENLANNDNSGSKSIIEGSKKNIIKWIAIVIVVAVGVGSLTFAVKNCCNINGTLLSLARLKHLQRCSPKPKSNSGSPFPDHQVMR